MDDLKADLAVFEHDRFFCVVNGNLTGRLWIPEEFVSVSTQYTSCRQREKNEKILQTHKWIILKLFTKRHKQIFLFGFGFIEKCVVVRIGDPPFAGDFRVGKIGDLTGDEKDIDGPVVAEPQRERYAAGIAAA